MKLLSPQPWINFLSLLPGTILTFLTITVAFLRFYDEQDFSVLGYITQPRVWSNRLTLAALVVAMVNFGIEWNRRNRETDRLAEAEQRRIEETARVENERTEERNRATAQRERAAHQARVQNRWVVLQIQHQLNPTEQTQSALGDFAAFLQEYGE
jgi:hypothetical protein